MEKRFVYRGNAVGASGQITFPQRMTIWVQGASALPTIGGYSQARVGPSDFAQFLTFESVFTQATGDFIEESKKNKTLVTSTVKTVTVDKRLTVDLLEATIMSEHPGSGEPPIAPKGIIRNLRLDGHPVEVTMDELFTEKNTRTKLADAYSKDKEFFKRHGHRFLSDKPLATFGKRKIPEMSGYIVATLVDNVRCQHPDVKIKGHIIELPGFGVIYLGELLIDAVSRRLTLLRVKLGSPTMGQLIFSAVESNGHTLP